jgi:hypothetical protein
MGFGRGWAMAGGGVISDFSIRQWTVCSSAQEDSSYYFVLRVWEISMKC